MVSRIGQLLPDAELSDQRTVTVEVFLLEVSQVAAALADEAKERLTAAVVFAVALQVFAQLLDAVGEQRDLTFGITGILRVTGVLLEDLLDLLFS